MDFATHDQEPAPSRALLIVGLYTLLAVVAVIIGAARDQINIYRLPGEYESWRAIVSPLAGIGVGLGIVFLSRMCVHQFRWARRLHQSFRGLLGGLHARDIFILAVASSVGEELLFRGALMPWVGLWPSTLIFALLHIGPGARFLPWTFSAFLAGLIFGTLFLWFGDLSAPIAAHFAVNYLNLNFIVRVDLPSD